MQNNVDQVYRKPGKRKKTPSDFSDELTIALGGGKSSVDLSGEQQEGLLEQSGLKVTRASFFLRHGDTKINFLGDGVKGRKEPLDSFELAGHGSIARSAKALKSALGSLQDIQIHISPTVRCLQTLQLVLQEFKVNWTLTDERIQIISDYNESQDQQNLIINDNKLNQLEKDLGLPHNIQLSNQLSTRLKGGGEIEDLKPLFQLNDGGEGYLQAIGKTTNYIDRIQQSKKSGCDLFIGHRTLLAAADLSASREGEVPIHPTSESGEMRVTSFTKENSSFFSQSKNQLSLFVLPFPCNDFIKQNKQIISNLDESKTYIENQNILSNWLLTYSKKIEGYVRDKNYDYIKKSLKLVPESFVIAQCTLSVLLNHHTDKQIHKFIIEELESIAFKYGTGTPQRQEKVVTIFKYLLNFKNDEFNVYRKHCLSEMNRWGHAGVLISSLGPNHPKIQEVQLHSQLLTVLYNQQLSLKIRTLKGYESLILAYIDQQIKDSEENILTPETFILQVLEALNNYTFISAVGGMGKTVLSKQIVSLLTDTRILSLANKPNLRVQEVDLCGCSIDSLPPSQSFDQNTIVIIDAIDEIDADILKTYISSLDPLIRVIGLGRYDPSKIFSDNQAKEYTLETSNFESLLLNKYTKNNPSLKQTYNKLKQKLYFDISGGRQMTPLQIEALIKLAEDTELSGEFENISRSNIYEYMVRDIICRDSKRLQTMGSLEQFDTKIYNKDKEQLFQYLIRSDHRTYEDNRDARDRSKDYILDLQDEYLTAYQGETKLNSNSFGEFVERFLQTTSLLAYSGKTDGYRVFHETVREYFLNLPGGTVQKLKGEDYYIMRQDVSYDIGNQSISTYKLQTMINIQSRARKQQHQMIVKSGQYDVIAIKTSAIEELIKKKDSIPQIGDEKTIDGQVYVVLGRDPQKTFGGRDYKSIMNYLERCDEITKEKYIKELPHILGNYSRDLIRKGGLAVNKQYLEQLVQKTVPVILDELSGELIKYEQDYKVPLLVKKIDGTLLGNTERIIDQDGNVFEHVIAKSENYFKLLKYIRDNKDQEWRNQHCFLIPNAASKGGYQLYVSPKCLAEFESDLSTILQRKINPDTNTVTIDGKTYYYVGFGIDRILDQDGGLQFKKDKKDIGKSLFTKVKKLDETGIKQAVTVEGKTVDVIDAQTLRELLATRKLKPSTNEQLIETLS